MDMGNHLKTTVVQTLPTMGLVPAGQALTQALSVKNDASDGHVL